MFFSSLSTEFIDRFACSGYVSLINLQTRRISLSQTCLAHKYINSELSYVSGVIKALISEHDTVFCSVPQNKPVRKTVKRIKFREHPSNSLNAYKSKVAEGLNLCHLYDEFSIDEKMKIFFNIILNAFNSTCKIRENIISTKKQTSPWMTLTLLNRKQEKHRLYRLSVNSPLFKNQIFKLEKTS